MHKLDRGLEPTCLAKYRAGTHNWRSLTQDDKSQIRAALIEMQEERCAYCESALKAGKSHIEHFAPRGVFLAKTFCWENLFLSCGSDEPGENRRDKHCGKHKKAPGPDTYDIETLIKPDVDDPDDYLRFYANGDVHPRPNINDTSRNRAEVTIRELNLQKAVKLREKRRTAVELFKSTKAGLLEKLERLDDHSRRELIQQEIAATAVQPHCTVIRHFLSY